MLINDQSVDAKVLISGIVFDKDNVDQYRPNG